MIYTKLLNIVIEKGADFHMSFTVTDDEDNVVDLTGATVTAYLREYAEAEDYFTFTATHNGLGGKVSLTMSHEDTAQIGYTQGVYDVFVQFPDESTEKYLMGEVTVIPAVTRPFAGAVMYLLTFSSEEDFPITGNFLRLYYARGSSKIYSWDGTKYLEVVGEPVANWGHIVGNLPDQADLQDALDNKADVIICSASGSFLKIVDASARKALGLSVDINPVQDMNGYDAPWSAGNGENKGSNNFHTMSECGVDSDVLSDGTIHWHGTVDIPSGSLYVRREILTNGDWKIPLTDLGLSVGDTVSLYADNGAVYCLEYAEEDEDNPVAANYAQNGTVSFTVSESTSFVNLWYYACDGGAWSYNKGYEIDLISKYYIGKGAFVSWSPYENICPISGRNSVTLTVKSANLINCKNAYTDMNVDDGWYVESSAYRYKITGLPKSTAFTLSCVLDASLESQSQNRLYLIGSNSGFIDLSQGAGRYSITKNTTATGDIVVSLNKVCREDQARASHILKLQVELGSKMTDYGEYSETVFNVDLARTVYGGEIDIATGNLTVTDGHIDSYNGEVLPSAWISDRDAYTEGDSPTTGAQVVYKLAEPLSYTIPSQDVVLRKGGNTFLADSGDVSVEYRADTKLYIDNKLS